MTVYEAPLEEVLVYWQRTNLNVAYAETKAKMRKR